MISERYVTMIALWHKATHLATCHRSITTPVKEKYRLHTTTQCTGNILAQLIREYPLDFTLLPGKCHIDKTHFRQLSPLVSFQQLHKSISSIHSFPECLHRRGSTTQKCLRPMHRSKHHSGISGIISWSRVLLLISRFMLLIHYDKPQRTEWQEH